MHEANDMTSLDAAWSAWEALNCIERAKFLRLLRDAYAAEREARTGIVSYPKGADLADLTLSEAELEAALLE
jgi:hypothetical protein